jgi:hypothetical protein
VDLDIYAEDGSPTGVRKERPAEALPIGAVRQATQLDLAAPVCRHRFPTFPRSYTLGPESPEGTQNVLEGITWSAVSP